ncbi:MAG: acetate--CoA ligase family protein [Candidatus Methylomirabilia bacterium]
MTLPDPVSRARAEGRSLLSEAEAKRLLEGFGLAITTEGLVSRVQELEGVLDSIPPPWVMKVAAPDLPHKSDAGGVAVGIETREVAEKTFHRLLETVSRARPGLRIHGILVQEHVRGAVAELLLGSKRDEQFGPVIVLGLGGLFTELYDDLSMRVAPVDEAEALRMIEELRAAPLLRGYRAQPEADIPALARAVAALSRLAVDLEREIAEIDINPLMVLPSGQGVKVADALVVLSREAEP